MLIYVGTDEQHMILSHFFIYAMYFIQGMDIYVRPNRNSVSSEYFH